MAQDRKIRILFVCMGNICRSPTAEGVFRRLAWQAGLADAIHIDSAGTHHYHVGQPPDSRAQQAAKARGYDLSNLIGRQIETADFEYFDYILAMDGDNLSNLRALCPPAQQHKLSLFLAFSTAYTGQEVPDPYYGGPHGFDRVLDRVEDACRGLLAHIRAVRLEMPGDDHKTMVPKPGLNP